MDIKKLVLTGSIALFASGLYAQDRMEQQQREQQQPEQQQTQTEQEIPKDVKNQFEQEYASAKDVEWQTEGQNYEAGFELEGEEKEVLYNEQGKKELTSTEIKREELPESVNQTLQEDYADYKFDDFARIEKEEEGETYYKVEAEKNDKIKKLHFDSQGEKVKSSKIKKSKS